MIYQSIADIYNFNDEVRHLLVSRVESLTAEQHASRSDAEEAWSIAHIAEHLSIIESRMVGLISLLLKQSESGAATSAAAAAGGEANEETNDGAAGSITEDQLSSATAKGVRPFKPFSFDEIVAAARGKKFQAPAEMRPAGNVSAAAALAALEASRTALRELRPRLEVADLEAATYPHPVFGPLNIAQWLAFIGLHEGRHLRQIERLLAPPDTETQIET